MSTLKTVAFNYQALPENVRQLASDNAREISVILERTSAGIIEIGRRLIEVHEALGRNRHDAYSAWLTGCFRWTQATASNFEQVARKFGGLENNVLNRFPPSALYALMRRNVAPEAVKESIARARKGEIIDRPTVARIIRQHTPEGAAPSTARPDPVFELRAFVRRQARELTPTQQKDFVAELLELARALTTNAGADAIPAGRKPKARLTGPAIAGRDRNPRDAGDVDVAREPANPSRSRRRQPAVA